MIIAVDTSALSKILVEEAESPVLREHLTARSRAGDTFVVSAVALTELRRLAIRLGIDAERVEPVVRPFTVARLSEAILQLAGRLPHQHLGTLDAIHLATALSIEATELLTYQQRQADAATSEGLRVASPGTPHQP